MSYRYVILAALVLAAATGASQSAGPSDEIVALDGRRVSLAEYKGQVVVLEFWATWCDTCLKEVPKINRLHASSNGKWKVVAINTDETDRAKVSEFVAKHGMKYPVFVDEKGDMRWRFGIRGLPTTVLLDAKGEIAQKFVGPHDWDGPKMRGEIAKLLPPPTAIPIVAPLPIKS